MEDYNYTITTESSIIGELHKRRGVENMVALCGSSHPELAHTVSLLTGIRNVKIVSEKFSNTEIRVEIGENVRNRDVVLFQTGSYNLKQVIV